MANLNTTTSGYPAALDTAPTLTDGSSGDEIVAAHQNGRGSAIVNIETELGTDVAGTQTDLKTRLTQALNDDGTVKSSVIVALTPTFVNYAAGVFTVGSSPKVSGDIVQMISTQVSGFTTTTITANADNTPIQSTEGATFGLTVDMKPTNTLNTVYVRGDLQMAVSNGEGTVVWGLFLAASSSAIVGGSQVFPTTANTMNAVGFQWKATTVSTATTSYTLRIGHTTGGQTVTLNGTASAGLFGDAVASILTVYEVQN
jgi:hypothetical protein